MSKPYTKQWKDWCRRLNLTPNPGGTRDRYTWYDLKGRGRYWRINSLGQFQASEKYQTFDRWANSVEATHDKVPRSFAELNLFVDSFQTGDVLCKSSLP